MADRPLRFLALDGGGIRGYSELLILEAILQRVRGLLNLPSMPLPADYFDLIGGTSAGGLIAIMLGKLQMSVEEAKDTFRTLSSEMFKQKNFLWKFREDRYNEKVFTSIIQDVIQRKLNDKNARLRSAEEQPCKMFVCTVSSTAAMPKIRLFRSYEASWNHEHDCTIWEAARATAAAPTYYSPMKLGTPDCEESFIDGGVGCNNPIQKLHLEAERLFDPNREVGCIISLGTGKRKVNEILDSQMFGASVFPIELIKSFKRLALDSEIEANKMDIRYRGTDGVYYRFNVEHGLEDVKLSDFEKMGRVESHTRAYMGHPKVQEMLDQVAAALAGQGSIRRRPFVVGYLSPSFETVISATLNQSSNQRPAQDDISRHQQLFSSIRTQASPLEDYMDNLAKRFRNDRTGYATCSWIFQDEKFLDTCSTRNLGILWLEGVGSGKSVLASVVIEELSKKYLTLYYFCHQTPQPTTLKHILCGILEQISQLKDDRVMRKLCNFTDSYPNLAELGEGVTNPLFELCRSILLLTEGKVFIVIDAIDFCSANPYPAYHLVTGLNQGALKDRLRFIFTSQKGAEDVLRNVSSVKLNELNMTVELIAPDLKEYVSHRLASANSALIPNTLVQRHEITETTEAICKRARGIFLQASIFLDDLEATRPPEFAWQNNIFAVDEARGFAYSFHYSQLQCYHIRTNTPLAALPFDNNRVYEQAALSPDKRCIALTFSVLLPEVDDEIMSHISRIQKGLQLRLTDRLDEPTFEWKLENEDNNETVAVAKMLGVPMIRRIVCVVQLNHDGLERDNFFNVLPGRTTFDLLSYDTPVMWRIDDPEILVFSPDSRALFTAKGIISLAGRMTHFRWPLQNEMDCKGTKVTGDMKTLATIRNRKTVELWDIGSGTLRRSIPLKGVGHLLAISQSGRYILLLMAQNATHYNARRAPAAASGQPKKLKPQQGVVSIFDCRHGSWIDFATLGEDSAKHLDAWKFDTSPVMPQFTMEKSPPRVLMFLPAGWSIADGVQCDPEAGDRNVLGYESQLLVFACHRQLILQRMISVTSDIWTIRNSFQFPKIVTWNDDDTVTACFKGKISRCTLDDVQSFMSEGTRICAELV